jgi:hypothetical protein
MGTNKIYLTENIEYKVNIEEYTNVENQINKYKKINDSIEFVLNIEMKLRKINIRKVNDLTTMRHNNNKILRDLNNVKYKEEEIIIQKAYSIIKKKNNLNDSEVFKVRNKIKDICLKYNLVELNLLCAFYKESGFNTKIQNRDSKATGIFQLTESTILTMNNVNSTEHTINSIKKNNIFKQLDLFEEYILMKKYVIKKDYGIIYENIIFTPENTYLLIFYPMALKYNMNKPIISKIEKAKTYKWNENLDIDKDGIINKEDISKMMNDIKIKIMSINGN